MWNFVICIKNGCILIVFVISTKTVSDEKYFTGHLGVFLFSMTENLHAQFQISRMCGMYEMMIYSLQVVLQVIKHSKLI